MPKLDRAKVKAAGWTDAAIDSYLVKHPNVQELTSDRVMGLGATPPTPEPPSNIPAATASAMTPENPGAADRQAAYPTVKEVATGVAPSVAAGLLTAAVPATAPAAWLLRMATAGGAGFGTELGMQQVRGEEFNPKAAAVRGGLEMGGQGLGELVGIGLPAAGKQLVKSGLHVGKPQASAAVEMGEQLAGKPVRYADVDLADQAIKEGVAPGGKIGQPKMQELKAAPMRRRAEILAEKTKAGKTFTRQDYMRDIGDLKREILAEGGTVKDIDAIDRLVTEFVEGGRGPSQIIKGRKVQGKMQRDTPEAAEVMKEGRQAKAKALYASSTKGRASLRARFDEHVAHSIMRRLEELTPPAVPGGHGEIESLNRRYRSLLPLDEAVKNAELPRASSGNFKDLNPLHLVSPNVRGRAGLMLASPTASAVGRQAPRAAGSAAYALMQMLRDRSAADADTTGIVE